jgi:hypothetical protein
MEILTSEKQPSFYCNRCDKWVDGIEDKENAPAIGGFKQVLCDECGGAIRYRLPSYWEKLSQEASVFFSKLFGSSRK